MVINVGPGGKGTGVQFYFTDPLGGLHNGDPNFSFVTGVFVQEPFPLVGFPAQEAFVYTFGIGELSIAGPWQVYAISGSFVSSTVTFKVLNLPVPIFH